jgi:hypothetical protein
MKKVVVLVLAAMALNSRAEMTLPDYGIEDTWGSPRKAYFSAIKLDLEEKGLGNCAGTRGWYLVSYFLDPERRSELYVLDGDSPLFVVRGFPRNYKSVNVVDFKIYTNPEMTEIVNVEYVEYWTWRGQVNLGTLKEPILENRHFARKGEEGACYPEAFTE